MFAGSCAVVWYQQLEDAEDSAHRLGLSGSIVMHADKQMLSDLEHEAMRVLTGLHMGSMLGRQHRGT